MTHDVSEQFPVDDDRPWGKTNPRRGEKHVLLAMEFLKEFPVDDKAFSVDAFDKWAHMKGLLDVPFGAAKKSDAWLAHLQRRHRLRCDISKAGTHLDMDTPFTIEANGPTLWAVKSPRVSAYHADRLMSRVNTLMKTRSRKLDYLMRSVDWAELPIYERMFADRLYDDIRNFGALVEQLSGQLNGKFDRLRHDLDRAVARGEIKPKNSAIKAIVDDSDDDTHAED